MPRALLGLPNVTLSWNIGKIFDFSYIIKKLMNKISIHKFLFGALKWNRTTDTGIFSPLLYRLSYEAIWRSQRDSNPRSSAWQADVLTSCTMRPNWLREKDLNLRPQGYEPCELPNCSIPRYNGGGKGIRTPAPLARPPGFQDRSLQPDLGIPPNVYFQTTKWL